MVEDIRYISKVKLPTHDYGKSPHTPLNTLIWIKEQHYPLYNLVNLQLNQQVKGGSVIRLHDNSDWRLFNAILSSFSAVLPLITCFFTDTFDLCIGHNTRLVANKLNTALLALSQILLISVSIFLIICFGAGYFSIMVIHHSFSFLALFLRVQKVCTNVTCIVRAANLLVLFYANSFL